MSAPTTPPPEELADKAVRAPGSWKSFNLQDWTRIGVTKPLGVWQKRLEFDLH